MVDDATDAYHAYQRLLDLYARMVRAGHERDESAARYRVIKSEYDRTEAEYVQLARRLYPNDEVR